MPLLRKIGAALSAFLATHAGAIVKRVASAFLVAFAASLVGSGVLTLKHITDLSLWQQAALAGVAAALALVQSMLSQAITGSPALLPLLRMLTPSGRAQAAARKGEARVGRIRALPVRRRYGKAPAVPIEQCPRLDKYMAAAKLPKPAKELNWVAKLVIAWGMMLNNRIGDCTIAAVGHAIQVMTGVARGAAVTLSDGTILSAYETLSGYNPTTGANDNGCVEADVLAYWRASGIGGHLIRAYGRVDHTNLAAVKQTIALFGFAYIGTAVPAAWEQAPAVWGIPHSAAGKQIVGGHAVILVGWDDAGFWLVSWGQIFKITYAAFAKYVDEVWGVVSQDWIEADRKAPSGLSITGLIRDLDQLDQQAA